jgi:hypothetical protein
MLAAQNKEALENLSCDEMQPAMPCSIKAASLAEFGFLEALYVRH